MAEGQGVGPKEEHRPDDLARERRTDTRGVAHEEVLLELAAVRGIDRRGGQVAKTGRDAVDDLAGCDEPLDDVANCPEPRLTERVVNVRNESSPPKSRGSRSACSTFIRPPRARA